MSASSIACVRAILKQDLRLRDTSGTEVVLPLSGVNITLRNDSAMPSAGTMTPLLAATLFASVQGGIVSVRDLLPILKDVSENEELMASDVIHPMLTMGTTC